MSILNNLVNFLSGYDVAELKRKHNHLHTAVEGLRSENEQLKEQLKRIESALQGTQESLELKKGELEGSQKEQKHLQKVLTLEKNKNTGLGRKIETLKSEKQDLQAQMGTLEKSSSELQTKVNELNEECNHVKLQIVEKEEALQNATIEQERLTAELEALRTSITEVRAEKENEIANQKAQIDSLKAELEESRQNTASTDELRVLESQVQHLEEVLQGKDRELELANHEKTSKENEMQAVIAELESVRIDFNRLKGELENEHSRKMEVQNQLSLRERELAEWKKQYKDKDAEILSMKARINSLEEELTREKTLPKQAEAELTTVMEAPEKAIPESILSEQSALIIAEEKIEEKTVSKENTEILITSVREETPKEIVKPVETTGQTIHTPIRKTVRKTRINQAVDLSEGDIEDFPEITNDSAHSVKRTIEFVKKEDGNIIYADDFFTNSTAEEIARIARLLAKADMKGETFWCCGMCGKRVKIAHREYGGKESLFFIHTNRDTTCEWLKKSTKSKDEVQQETMLTGEESMDEEQLENEQERINKPRQMKELIYALLKSDKSAAMGVDKVQMDTIVRSDFPYMRWRRPDLSFTFGERNMALQLQRKKHTTTDITDRDIFYRLTNTHVIWIFGCENDMSYDYMRKSSYKNTLFHNHRNVFVFDKEAQEESVKQNKLLLKCNWLDTDDEWAIQLETDGKNGRLVSLDELTYDDEYCKPYFHEANAPYFEKHPDAKQLYENSLETREELMKALEEKWTQDAVYEEAQNDMHLRNATATPFKSGSTWGFRFNTTMLVSPIFTEEPKWLNEGYFVVKQGKCTGLLNRFAQKKVDWDGCFTCDIVAYEKNERRVIIKENGKYGVFDRVGNVIITPTTYDYLSRWNTHAYKVQQNGKWGICNLQGELLTDQWYEEIGAFLYEKAEATLKQADGWKHYKGYLNENGQPIPTKCISQANGWSIVQQFERWGLKDEQGNVILPFEFDGISNWYGTLYRVKKGEKWGVIDTFTGEYKLPIAYDYINNLQDGIATVKQAGLISNVDLNGKETAQQIINLQQGYKKIKMSGKWGIVDAFGQEIVATKYDEIGSFRGRLIGVINQRLIKLDAYYGYPMLMSAVFESTTPKSYIFNLSGVKCVLPKLFLKGKSINEVCDTKNQCNRLAFSNLILSKQIYLLGMPTDNNLSKHSSHSDRETDFSPEEILKGRISNFKRYKKGEKGYIVTKAMIIFEDNRKSMVPRRFFKASNLNIEDYDVGDELVLKKIGFDDELDQTVWKIIL